MMNESELAMHVRKRIKAGFPAGEIRTDLEAEGYAQWQIDEAFHSTTQKKKGSGSPLAYIVSVVFIILGAMRISSGNNKTWGYFLFIYGIVSLVIKIVADMREREEEEEMIIQ
jgi:hypothetical protein